MGRGAGSALGRGCRPRYSIKSGNVMFSRVYKNGYFDCVKQNRPDRLIKEKENVGFRREGKTTVLGRAPQRRQQDGDYIGPELRRDCDVMIFH